MNETTKEPIGRPALTFRHPNGKNTGSAILFIVVPATYERDGSVQMTVAKQQNVADLGAEEPECRYATFDWFNATQVKLNFVEAAEILMVFGGQASALCHAGKEGLYHNQHDATVSVTMKRSEDYARPGFILGVGRTPKADPNARTYHTFAFTPAEAFALREALRCKMGELAFGVKPATLSFGPVNPKEA